MLLWSCIYLVQNQRLSRETHYSCQSFGRLLGPWSSRLMANLRAVTYFLVMYKIRSSSTYSYVPFDEHFLRPSLFRSPLILSPTSRQADVGAASYTAWQGLYLTIYGPDMESHRRAFKDIMVFPGRRDQQESVGAMEYAAFYRGGNGKIPLSGR
ncbi:hypothetical protein OIU77_029151 [Salix suchowensis]|uniref:Uncharacterized protein n=1 Tax=Salix suchowensis TaxID=1278906 RepID=A0ABQ9BNT4_9ROSI|nr:hypothetical protein OIU77_029151 [Salix suchowensis]